MGQELSSALSAVFPQSVNIAVVGLEKCEQKATEPELAALGAASDARLREFSAGRVAARRAMHGINLPPADILVGRHRQPLAPAGVLISITHDQEYAVAAATVQSRWHGIGIDIAQADELPVNLHSMVCRGQDLENLREGETVGQRAKLIFCLKEALFKAIFPQVNDWMNFSQSEICVDHGRGEFSAQVYAEHGAELSLQGAWHGRFARVGERWFAAAGLSKQR